MAIMNPNVTFVKAVLSLEKGVDAYVCMRGYTYANVVCHRGDILELAHADPSFPSYIIRHTIHGNGDKVTWVGKRQFVDERHFRLMTHTEKLSCNYGI